MATANKTRIGLSLFISFAHLLFLFLTSAHRPCFRFAPASASPVATPFFLCFFLLPHDDLDFFYHLLSHSHSRLSFNELKLHHYLEKKKIGASKLPLSLARCWSNALANRSAASRFSSLAQPLCSQRLSLNSPQTIVHATAYGLERATYSSLYEKNFDDQVHPTVVPDHVIQTAHSDKYWAPHPKTGIFGPPSENHNFHPSSSSSPATASAGSASVLEEKAWFRPTSLEDLEKPHYLA